MITGRLNVPKYISSRPFSSLRCIIKTAMRILHSQRLEVVAAGLHEVICGGVGADQLFMSSIFRGITLRAWSK